MKVLIGIQHPKQVHLFRNSYFQLTGKQHQVKVLAIDKEITRELLEKYHIPYILLGKNQPTLGKKALSLVGREYQTLKIAREFRPDLIVGRAVPHLAHVSALLRIPFIIFEDTELAAAIHKITVPFASTIITPSSYLGNFGEKHIRYNGFDELSYLHPRYFSPDPGVLKDLGLKEGDPFIILRFISWNAYHDSSLKGISDYTALIRELEPFGKVFVSSEGPLDPALEKYRLRIEPDKAHSLLYYASLYLGEGGTMAAEAAILGTPAIHIEGDKSGGATGNTCGNFRELHDRYGMLYFFADQDAAFSKATELLKNRNVKQEWQKKREALLHDKIDVTAWITDFIERYPDSFYKNRGLHG